LGAVPIRLVDLYCDWSRQYAAETTEYEGTLYPEVSDRVGRLDGYLLGASLTLLACARKPEDWSTQSDVWRSLGRMITRYEAEFTGRIIRDGGDVTRWRSAPADGLCWGVIGVAGFDSLVREPDDLDRLAPLFQHGVRVFQPVSASEGMLGGSTAPGDDHGLTDLGESFLARLVAMTPTTAPGPRPILDLAGKNARTLADTLRRLDEHPAPGAGLPLVVTRGTFGYRNLLEEAHPDARNLRDLRSRGGVIGLTPGLPGCETAEDVQRLIDLIAAIPFQGRSGYEGIAIGSDLLVP
jgi:membrane dipeptidase